MKIKKRSRQQRSPIKLAFILILWSVILGWGLAIAATPVANLIPSPTTLAQIDPVPERFQVGQQLYLENCSTCHIPVPPAVLPIETWRQLLQDPQHYGRELQLLVDPPRLLVWNYLQIFSRPHAENEEVPYRIANSRYFKALHPRVELPRPLTVTTCVSCHPGAPDFNFRTLTPEWQDAP